jgi:hypothetical protein
MEKFTSSRGGHRVRPSAGPMTGSADEAIQLFLRGSWIALAAPRPRNDGNFSFLGAEGDEAIQALWRGLWIASLRS